MIFRFLYVPFLLLPMVEARGGAWRHRSPRTSLLLSSMNENLTKDHRTVIQQRAEATKREVKKKINDLSKESETLANEKLSKAEQAARDRLEQLSEEAGSHASERISKAEQAVLDKIEALEESAKYEGRRQANLLEAKTRDKLSSLEQAVESKIGNFFNRILPSGVPEVRKVHILSDQVSGRLLKVLVGLVLISSFGNLSGQMKAWEFWEASEGEFAFGDHYFPFPVDFIAKRTLAGVLELTAVGLLTIPSSAKGITTKLGSAILALMFGRAVLIHEGLVMFAFSTVAAIIAVIVFLNDCWLVPSKDLDVSPSKWNERKKRAQITVAVLALILILKRKLAKESYQDRFDEE